MPIDLFQSRGTYHEECRWWHRNENEQLELDEIVMKRVADGFFMAKEVAPIRQQDSQISGMFMFNQDMITIKTPDNVSGINSEDIVQFRDMLWRVVSVQQSQARNQSNVFSKNKNCSHYWYLELRR